MVARVDAQPIYQHAAQPAPEVAAAQIVAELREFPHQNRKHFLDQIVHVGRLQGIAAEPIVDERRVQVNETAATLSNPAESAIFPAN